MLMMMLLNNVEEKENTPKIVVVQKKLELLSAACFLRYSDIVHEARLAVVMTERKMIIDMLSRQKIIS
jgi:hypothetical protein